MQAISSPAMLRLVPLSAVGPRQQEPKLLDLVRTKVRLLHYSKRTEEAYDQRVIR